MRQILSVSSVTSHLQELITRLQRVIQHWEFGLTTFKKSMIVDACTSPRLVSIRSLGVPRSWRKPRLTHTLI